VAAQGSEHERRRSHRPAAEPTSLIVVNQPHLTGLRRPIPIRDQQWGGLGGPNNDAPPPSARRRDRTQRSRFVTGAREAVTDAFLGAKTLQLR
jgi:hypothetical protein